MKSCCQKIEKEVGTGTSVMFEELDTFFVKLQKAALPKTVPETTSNP